MPHSVKIPAVGESVTEGTLSRWLVADGATVTDTTPLFELETDKISTEVQSGTAGVVRLKAKAGDVLPVGAVVAEIEAAPAGAAAPNPLRPAPEPRPTAPAAVPASAAQVAPPPQNYSAQPLSPAVQALVAEHRVDPAAIAGTGKDGRLTKGDVLETVAKRAAAPAAAAPAAEAKPAAPAAGATRKRMSPLRARIAQRLVQAQHTAAILTTFNEIDMSAAMGAAKALQGGVREEARHRPGLHVDLRRCDRAGAAEVSADQQPDRWRRHRLVRRHPPWRRRRHRARPGRAGAAPRSAPGLRRHREGDPRGGDQGA